MKRSYTKAEVAEEAGGYTIKLDGRVVRTPAGSPLVTRSQPLAAAMAAEWAVQSDTVKPKTMPFTQLTSTAIDRVGPRRDAVIDELVAYGGTDLLCYRADSPQDLVERQERAWQPLVDWASVVLGAEMVVTSGVVPVSQPPATLARLRQIIEGYDVFRLTALQSAVAAMGSLLLGLALLEGRLGAEEAFAVSQLDELYQAELWGEDPEAAGRRQNVQEDIAAAARLLELYGQA